MKTVMVIIYQEEVTFKRLEKKKLKCDLFEVNLKSEVDCSRFFFTTPLCQNGPHWTLNIV